MKWFLILAILILAGINIYQARTIKQQKDLINAMWLDKHVPCDNDNTEYQKHLKEQDMKKLVLISILATLAVNANAGVLKFSAKESGKVLKAGYHSLKSAGHFAKKVLY